MSDAEKEEPAKDQHKDDVRVVCDRRNTNQKRPNRVTVMGPNGPIQGTQ